MTPANPFGHYGSVVAGPLFYGREAEVRRITERVLGGPESGNVAVIGLPRIGKSSLVWHTFGTLLAGPLAARRKAVVFLNLATFHEPKAFFQGMALGCHERLEDQEWLTTPIDRAKARLDAARAASEAEFNAAVLRYFAKVRLAGLGVLFVLDEFDGVRQLFKGRVADFQMLRELCSAPATKVTLVTASRRPIDVLEVQAGCLSTLANVMGEELYLRPFSADKIGPFYDRCAAAGVNLDAAGREQVVAFTGLHPYLLDMIGFNLVQESGSGGPADVGAVCERTSPAVVPHYDEVFRVLRDAELLSKLTQVLFGPVYDLQPQDIESLLRYGLLTRRGDSYTPFSTHFADALRVEMRDVEYWPLWRDAEQGLRTLVGAYLAERFGEEWGPGLRKARPSLAAMLDGCRDKRAHEQRLFGLRASQDLLDYTYPMDLFQIMKTDWGWFRRVLKGEAADWEREFTILAQVRAPLAHNRDTRKLDRERSRATAACQQILERLQSARH